MGLVLSACTRSATVGWISSLMAATSRKQRTLFVSNVFAAMASECRHFGAGVCRHADRQTSILQTLNETLITRSRQVSKGIIVDTDWK